MRFKEFLIEAQFPSKDSKTDITIIEGALNHVIDSTKQPQLVKDLAEEIRELYQENNIYDAPFSILNAVIRQYNTSGINYIDVRHAIKKFRAGRFTRTSKIQVDGINKYAKLVYKTDDYMKDYMHKHFFKHPEKRNTWLYKKDPVGD